MRLDELRRETVARLGLAGISRPGLEADLLLADVLRISRVSLYSEPGRDIPDAELVDFLSRVRRREAHEPLEYILGKAEFYGLPLSVGPGCLIPRPETELLVDIALREGGEAGGTFLDWGTGSGCIALSLLHERPFWTGLAVEASPLALTWAWRNLKRYGLLERCLLIHADSPEMLAVSTGSLDLMVSNPPYIPSRELPGLMPEVRDYEPRLALDGGEAGLDPYYPLLGAASRWLRPGGCLLVEIGDSVQAEVLSGTSFPGMTFTETFPDLEGRPRVLMWHAYRL